MKQLDDTELPADQPKADPDENSVEHTTVTSQERQHTRAQPEADPEVKTKGAVPTEPSIQLKPRCISAESETTMSNAANNTNLIGRLAGDPKVFENADGSQKVLYTLYVDRDYTNRAGVRESDALPLEAFVPSNVAGVGPYANIHKGDLVAVSSVLRMDTYDDAAGKTIYKLKIVSEGIRFLESRTVTGQRLATRVQNAQAAATQTPAAAPAQVPAAAPASAQVPAATPASDQAQFAQMMNQATVPAQVDASAHLPFPA